MPIKNAAPAAIAFACLIGTGLSIGVTLLNAGSVQAAPFSLNFDVLLADQGLDGVYRSRDFNGDGDANDAWETTVYFNADNASGLVNPSRNVFTILQSRSGHQYIGDGSSDSVYRLSDVNGDGDANDTGEAGLWFSEDNAAGLTLPTPNGIGEDRDNNIYIVNAGVGSRPADGIYRTRDLNGDGDANDAGEASLWLDLARLNPSASAFEVTFQGNVAFVADTVGGDTNVIYRAEDNDGNGEISDDEVSVFIDGNNPYGASIDFALAGDDTSLYIWEFLDIGAPQSLFKLTDLDGSGIIDDVLEVSEIWDTTLLPSGFESFAGFGVAVDADGNIVLTSNGGDANQDNIFLLQDLNGDGDYRDAGETGIWLSRQANGSFPDRPRAVAFTSQNPVVAVAEPGSLPLLAIGLFSVLGLSGLAGRRDREGMSGSGLQIPV
ncbi:hypothetical protein [Pelagibius sp. Alg239-R121]|uniref:hypothetical protein n=1 Tax=Pelagibius sp. Alg239-R121 TaxID=2993448 RepID=UPI0024A7671D|nr:hypothetical protein [Pelagibius sp. Alg239-R121]